MAERPEIRALEITLGLLDTLLLVKSISDEDYDRLMEWYYARLLVLKAENSQEVNDGRTTGNTGIGDHTGIAR